MCSLLQHIAVNGQIDDAMLMDYVLEAHLSHDLVRIAARELRRRIPTRDEVSGKGAKRVGWRETPPEDAARFLAESAAALRAAGSVLKGETLGRRKASEGLRRHRTAACRRFGTDGIGGHHGGRLPSCAGIQGARRGG